MRKWPVCLPHTVVEQGFGNYFLILPAERRVIGMSRSRDGSSMYMADWNTKAQGWSRESLDRLAALQRAVFLSFS